MADDATTQAHLRAALPHASSVVIVLRIGDREQQFDGSWLRQMLQDATPRGGEVSAQMDDVTAEGAPPA